MISKEAEAFKEAAKATQEVAKTASKAIDAGTSIGKFFTRFISGSLEQGAGIIEDKLRYIRWERQVRLMNRSEEYLNQQGLSEPDNPLPLKHAIPLFEYATLEEDDRLQDIWARLLVNGTHTSTGINIERSFIEILAQISFLEAQILQTIYALPFDETRKHGVITEKLPRYAKVDEERSGDVRKEPNQDVKLALANLTRLGCLKFPLTWDGAEIFTVVNTTLIGYEFVSACTINQQQT